MGVGVGRLSVPCGEDAIAAVVFRLVRGGQALGSGVGCGGVGRGVGGGRTYDYRARAAAMRFLCVWVIVFAQWMTR